MSKVRLDRVMADAGWRDTFPNASVKHIISSCSNHCALLARLQTKKLPQNKRRCWQYELF